MPLTPKTPLDVQTTQDAIALIRSTPEAMIRGGVSAQLIAAAEARLGVPFPAPFRLYLGELGQVSIGGTEVYGLVNDAFDANTVPCAVGVTLRKRRLGLPEQYVVVHAVGDGTLLAIDTSSIGAPVVAWRHESVMVDEEYSDFGDFLYEIVEDEIDRLRKSL